MLGLGNIGSRIGTLFKAFGATVYGTSDRRKADETIDRVFQQANMTEAVREADIVICALPLTPETRGQIGRDFIAAMKPGVLLVNVSRAAVIDEDALYEALQSGLVGGFAADVWWKTPGRGESISWPSAKYEFQKMENVVMSPHRAGFIENGLPHLDGAIENIAALIRGDSLQNQVDRRKAY